MYNKKQWESNELITKEALNNIENGIETLDKRKSNAYFIDLEEWGIHNGFLGEREYVLGDDGNYLPKYTDEEYDIAHNNKEGLNAALQYAVDNGYDTAVLPNSSKIFICWEEANENCYAYYAYNKKHIIMPSNLDFNMNNSTIKVIFDSKNRNPYDKSRHDFENPIYRLNGYLITMNACYNSSIRNGTLLGTLYERAYIVDSVNETGTERNFDFGVGINIGQGSSFIKIDNMTIKGFMADGIASMTDHDPAKGNALYNPPFNHKGYIKNTGELIEQAGCFTTDLLDISDWNTKEAIMRTNIGYTRVPNIFNESFFVSFFDKDKNFILVSKERYLQNFLVPNHAKYMRVSIMREPETTQVGVKKEFQITPKAGEFCHINFCDISENHRGGIANMVNNTIVERCKIYNNGMGAYENVSAFGDTTRYGINCEDCLPLNFIVRDTYFYNMFHGILFAGGTIHCQNNIFNKISSSPLCIYNCENAFFSENTIIASGNLGSTGSSVYDRTFMIKNNKFIDSSFSLGAANNLNSQVSGNVFKGLCNFSAPIVQSQNRDILFDFYRNDDYTYVGGSCNASNCHNVIANIHDTLYSTAGFRIESNKNSRDVQFNNVCTYGNPRTVSNQLYNSEVNDFTYLYSSYNNMQYEDETGYWNYNVSAINCELNNTGYKLGDYANCNIEMNYVFKDTKFNINNKIDYLFQALWYNNEFFKKMNFKFESCEFNISKETFNAIFKPGNAKFSGDIIFNNCIFNSDIENEISLFSSQWSSIPEGTNLNIRLNNCKINGKFKCTDLTTVNGLFHLFINDEEHDISTLI